MRTSPFARLAAHYAKHAKLHVSEAAREISELIGIEVKPNAASNQWRRIYPNLKSASRRISASSQAAAWLAEHGGTVREVAERFGITHQALSYRWRQIEGRGDPPTVQKREWRRKQAVELVAIGDPLQVASDSAQVTTDTVRKYAREVGLKPLTPFRERQIRLRDAVLAEVDAGATIMEAAVKAGCGRHTVQRVLKEAGRKMRMGRSRDDGRSKRAVARILAGEGLIEACRAELASDSSVRGVLRRMKQR